MRNRQISLKTALLTTPILVPYDLSQRPTESAPNRVADFFVALI